MGLVPDASLDRSYIRGSTYSLRLREYLEVIGSDAVKVILFDDLCKDYKKTFLNLLNWLGLDSSEQLEPVVSNKTSRSIARHLVNHSRFKASIHGVWRVTPSGLKAFVKRSDVFFSQRSNLSRRQIDEKTLLFFCGSTSRLKCFLYQKLSEKILLTCGVFRLFNFLVFAMILVV